MAKSDYLGRLQLAVETMHGCFAVHAATVPVHEVFQGQTVWRGDVEVFDITEHARAKRCYAWTHTHGKGDDKERFVSVLELPPVVSPETAVRAAIVADAKKRR